MDFLGCVHERETGPPLQTDEGREAELKVSTQTLRGDADTSKDEVCRLRRIAKIESSSNKALFLPA